MLPDNIRDDHSLRVYLRLNDEGLIKEKWVRDPAPNDISAVMAGDIMTRKPEFSGEWRQEPPEKVDELNEVLIASKSKRYKVSVMDDAVKEKREAKRLTDYEKELVKMRKLLEDKLKGENNE